VSAAVGAAAASPARAPASATAAPGWSASLRLRYWRDGDRTLAHDAHEGPLRVLQRLYPEGPGICHHVVVHPPGGVVGGDRLALQAQVGPGCHAVLTTPGATRFYRSGGAQAEQRVTLAVADGARLEWLPMEAIAYRGCDAASRVELDLAPGAEMIGWDVLALGLPESGQAFDTCRLGRFRQEIAWPRVWLERGTLAAADTRLLHGPLGLDSHAVLAVAWFASGRALPAARREALLAAARGEPLVPQPGQPSQPFQPFQGGEPQPAVAHGATSPDERLVLLRLLAHRVEPAMARLHAVRAAWRTAAWGLAAQPPRIWRT
jgi:urease accessory protein